MSHPSARFIRDVPDFPKRGILFKDLTTLFKDPEAFRHAMADLEALIDWDAVDLIAAVEARGFIVGGYLAARRGLGFVPIRKPGRLPAETLRETYSLEYGTDTLEIHRDACEGGKGVLIVDDLLATGGTARAAARLVEAGGGKVKAFAFLVELEFLDGRRQLDPYPVRTLIRYATPGA
jgi:adenine phosphoribosyltransferase